MLHFYF